jgi:KaiC/GvpD/RAD55 family RecA-like ATPase
MDYSLEIESAPESVPAGSSILLVHPSTGETDRIDTQFLKTDTDQLLVVSTRTTAREVKQKLEHYDVDESKATILDTLSTERGYTRRQSDNIRYISTPGDLDGIVDETRQFLDSNDGKLRVSVDSITEMIYYGDEERTLDAVKSLLDLLEDHDAVGLFHLARGVHEEDVLDEYRNLFEFVIELDEDGTVTSNFEE